jgi:PIN domain nuclease of toxin-antitoxin system
LGTSCRRPWPRAIGTLYGAEAASGHAHLSLELAGVYRLSERVAAELENPANELWISPIVIWEVLILAERGRVVLEPDAATWVRRACQAVPFREAPLNHEVAIQSRTIDVVHEDPADRFLAATALVYDLTPR